MAFCGKCGAELRADAKFCPSCGAPVPGAQQDSAQTPPPPNGGAANFTDSVKNLNNTADTTGEYDPQDIANNKVMAVLAYLGIFVLIPIFGAKNSKYARFHANQGLTLLLVDIVWSVVNGILTSVLGWIFPWNYSFGIYGGHGIVYDIVTAVIGLVWIPILVLIVIGIVNAATGKAKELPVIGKIRILK